MMRGVRCDQALILADVSIGLGIRQRTEPVMERSGVLRHFIFFGENSKRDDVHQHPSVQQEIISQRGS